MFGYYNYLYGQTHSIDKFPLSSIQYTTSGMLPQGANLLWELNDFHTPMCFEKIPHGPVIGKCEMLPFPQSVIVHVTNARSGADAASVRKVVVFSMHGLAVLEAEASNHFDVTDLATGSYIVKVVDELGRCEYLKLVKQ